MDQKLLPKSFTSVKVKKTKEQKEREKKEEQIQKELEKAKREKGKKEKKKKQSSVGSALNSFCSECPHRPPQSLSPQNATKYQTERSYTKLYKLKQNSSSFKRKFISVNR